MGENMKNLLVNGLFDNYKKSNSVTTLQRIQKIRELSFVLSKVSTGSADTVALVSDNQESVITFQILCILRGNDFVIFDSSNFDVFNIVNLKVKTLFIDKDFSDIHKSNISDTSINVFSNSFLNNVIDFYDYTIYVSNLYDYEELYSFSNSVKDRYRNLLDISQVSNEDLKIEFTRECVREHLYSTFYVIHPGISTVIPKVSVFNTEILFKGALKVIDELYETISKKSSIKVKHENLPVLSTQILEKTSYPYVFLNGVILSLFSKGKYAVEFKKKGYNTLLISSAHLEHLIEDLIEENPFLTWLNKYKFDWILSLLLKRKFFNTSKDLKLLLLYGNTTKRLRKYLKGLDLEIVYLYTMTEVSSFVSFEFYNKMSINKEPTVGVLPKHVILNTGSNKENSAEILINTEDRMSTYTDINFTELCAMSEKYIGMHGTLDIGKNVNGKLQVQGKASEIFKNENGLVIQKDLIYSIILDKHLVKDALLITNNSKLYLLVEVKLSTILYENISLVEVENLLNKEALKRINETVDRYSQVEHIFIIPKGFIRKQSKIKSNDYLL